MKTKRRVFFAFFLFSAVLLFPNPYDMILAGDPIIEDLRFLSLESNRSFLSFTAPLSPHEIKFFLDSLDVSLLSGPQLEAYNRIQSRLNPKARLNFSHDLFSVYFNISSTLEAGFRFNSDISRYPENPKTAPVLSVPFRFFFADSFQLYFEPSLIIDPEYYAYREYFSTNVPSQFEHIDMTVPLRAFAAAGGSWWNFQLGRDRLSFGTGISGNLAISDNPAFYDFARFSVFSKYFKYSAMVNQMPLAITGDVYDKADTLDPDESLVKTNQRYLYVHRLDLCLFNKLAIGVTEGVMAGNSGLEVRYLNPFIVYHSLFSFWDYPDWNAGPAAPNGAGAMNGSLFSVEINWNIIRLLSVYGQFVMNQFATAYKLEQWPNQPPNSLGYLAGVNYSRTFKKWGSVFYLEFIYTDPYLYMNPSPFASHIYMRNLGYSADRHQYMFYGYRRDAIALTAGAKFFDGERLAIHGEFSWLCSGEHGVKWDWEKSKEAYNENTPSGTAENKFICGIGVNWKPLPFLALDGKVTGIFALNNGHVSGSDAAGGQAVFSVSFLY